MRLRPVHSICSPPTAPCIASLSPREDRRLSVPPHHHPPLPCQSRPCFLAGWHARRRRPSFSAWAQAGAGAGAAHAHYPDRHTLIPLPSPSPRPFVRAPVPSWDRLPATPSLPLPSPPLPVLRQSPSLSPCMYSPCSFSLPFPSQAGVLAWLSPSPKPSDPPCIPCHASIDRGALPQHPRHPRTHTSGTGTGTGSSG